MALIKRDSKNRPHLLNIFFIFTLHVLAFSALPYFTWQLFFLVLFLHYFISGVGVTLTYHRLLTHRAFKVPKWLEYTLATIAALSAQGPVLLWVAEHRLHHRYSDQEQDPHNSNLGFFYSHMGHLFYHKEFEDNESQWLKYVPDLAPQKYYQFLNRFWWLIALSLAPVLYYFGGWTFVMWGMFVRIVFMLHCTWFVNSATHSLGYRNFDTNDRSTNCWWVAILAAGEGWHNNHHAQANCAAHGRRWFEIDLTYMGICFLEAVGLATDVKKPKPVISNKDILDPALDVL